jgi:hypothetical protein
VRTRVLPVLSGTLGAALLTAFAFLARAGDEGANNWPVFWELRSSDNGVLFQFMQDVFAGRPLDWSFSPQVYVFPELPISFLSFVLAGADVYRYYFVVAVIGNVLLFLALLLLVSVVFRADSTWRKVGRAALAFTPLVALPLLGTSWLQSFHLAPTYYYGMYLAIIAGPAIVLVRGRWRRGILAAALVLTAASNPLLLVFCFPPLVLVLLVLAIHNGVRSVRRPAIAAVTVIAVALVIRFTLFSSLQGASPFSYIDPELFAGRLRVLWPYLDAVTTDPVARTVFVAGAVLAVICFIGAVIASVLVLRGRVEREPRVLAVIYWGFLPVAGLAGTAVLMITHQLYLWPVIVAPMVFALLAIPGRWMPVGLIGAGALVLVLTIVSGAIPNLATTDRYFGFRNVETRCLDSTLETGAIGYATFSDSRRLSLGSADGIRLIPLKSDLSETTWLTNIDYPREDAGTFFYLNEAGDEPVMSHETIEALFGTPDAVIDCTDYSSIYLYENADSRAAIAEHFGVR